MSSEPITQSVPFSFFEAGMKVRLEAPRWWPLREALRRVRWIVKHRRWRFAYFTVTSVRSDSSVSISPPQEGAQEE